MRQILKSPGIMSVILIVQIVVTVQSDIILFPYLQIDEEKRIPKSMLCMNELTDLKLSSLNHILRVLS